MRTRDQRGVALPSPVVLLSAAAVLLAAIAFFATRGHGSDQVDVSQQVSAPSVSASPSSAATPATGAPKPKTHKPKKKAPTVQRSQVKVVVYNNTNIHGLAATVGDKVKSAGWDFQAADNWQGTVPATTVYYGDGLKAAGQQLALDLGVKRVEARDPSATGMLSDGLTVILTGPLS